MSAYVLTDKPRRMGPLLLEGAKGIGLSTGQGSDPQIQMRRSLKGPNTFSAWRTRDLGTQGEYFRRTVWHQMGVVLPPGTEIQLSWSDPVSPILTGLYEDG